jgi:ComF family protein
VRFTRAPVCEACLEHRERLRPAAECSRCGAPFENELPLHGTGLCGLCRRGVTDFAWGRGFGLYDGTLRHLIHLLKYDGMRPLALPLARRLVPLLVEAGPVDLLVPVPLDGRRERHRGFNQAAAVAAEVSRLSGIRLEKRALRRVRSTETQTGLSDRQRRLNVRGAFQVRHPEVIAGRNIALIDDVITTGATASACALTLERAGAARVVVLALARARRRIVEVPAAPARAAVAGAGA